MSRVQEKRERRKELKKLYRAREITYSEYKKQLLYEGLRKPRRTEYIPPEGETQRVVTVEVPMSMTDDKKPTPREFVQETVGVPAHLRAMKAEGRPTFFYTYERKLPEREKGEISLAPSRASLASKLEFKAEKEKGFKRQALKFGAFGVGVVSGFIQPVRKPVETLKGIGQSILYPRKSIQAVGESLILEPAKTTGEIAGTALFFKGIEVAGKRALKPIKERTLVKYYKPKKTLGAIYYGDKVATGVKISPEGVLFKRRFIPEFSKMPTSVSSEFFSQKKISGGQISLGIITPEKFESSLVSSVRKSQFSNAFVKMWKSKKAKVGGISAKQRSGMITKGELRQRKSERYFSEKYIKGERIMLQKVKKGSEFYPRQQKEGIKGVYKVSELPKFKIGRTTEKPLPKDTYPIARVGKGKARETIILKEIKGRTGIRYKTTRGTLTTLGEESFFGKRKKSKPISAKPKKIFSIRTPSKLFIGGREQILTVVKPQISVNVKKPIKKEKEKKKEKIRIFSSTGVKGVTSGMLQFPPSSLPQYDVYRQEYQQEYVPRGFRKGMKEMLYARIRQKQYERQGFKIDERQLKGSRKEIMSVQKKEISMKQGFQLEQVKGFDLKFGLGTSLLSRQKINTKLRQGLSIDTDIISKQKSALGIATIQKTTLGDITPTPSTPRFPTTPRKPSISTPSRPSFSFDIKSPKPSPPILRPEIDIPVSSRQVGFTFKTSQQKKKKSRKSKSKHSPFEIISPSVEASVFNIRGKIPLWKARTGLYLRPLGMGG